MTTIQLEVPDTLARLSSKVGEKVLLQAISESVRRLYKQDKQKLKETQKRIHVFEKKNKMDFEKFEKNFPDTNDYRVHEDWIEWSHLVDKAAGLKKEISEYERAYGLI